MKKDYIVGLTEEEADELMDEHWVGELVRCKNCIFGHWWSSEQVIVCDKLAKTLDANWFCADGVRKDD